MKVTIYELLGLVKDGKAPKEVRYRYGCLYKDFKFDAETSNYISDKDFLFGEDLTAMLNDKVEIIEEPKKQVELTEKEYLECLDEINKNIRTIRDYIPKPSFLKLEEEKKMPETLEDGARFQYSQIPSWFRGKELIDTINENFEKHQKAIYELIDCLKSKGDE